MTEKQSSANRMKRQIDECLEQIDKSLQDLDYWMTIGNWDAVFDQAQRIAKAAIKIMATLKAEKVLGK